MLNMGSQAINAYEATVTTKMAMAADKFQESISSIERALKGPFGEAITELLPHITDFAQALNGLITWFTALPGPVRITIGAIGGLLALFIALAPAISAIVTIGGALGALFATGGALASAGSIIAGILTVIQLTFAGVLTFLSGTVMPALIAFFSGPVGWTVLAVAAVVAMGIAFREPLTKFARWLWEWGKPIRQFWLNLWNGAAGFAKGAFETAAGVVKNIFRGMLQYVVDRINLAVGLINVLIKAFNKLPNVPDIPLLAPMKVPAFAQGGVVDRPTLAMVGEGGEREYVVPESRMAAASSNYLAGARGGAVLAGAASGGGTPTINITTGPVMEFDGQRYVTVTDMERAMRLTAEGVLGRIRTPAARTALGIR
jgi:hypothetical protein